MTDGGMPHSNFRLADILPAQLLCGLELDQEHPFFSHCVQKFRTLPRNLILVEAYSQHPEMYKIPWMWKRVDVDPDIYAIFY